MQVFKNNEQNLMSVSSKRYLIRDWKNFKEEKNQKLYSLPLQDNLFIWTAIVKGSTLTPINDAIFKILLIFPFEYPNLPPEVKLVDEKQFHPNIYANGMICLDILQKKWSPSFSLITVLTSIQTLFFEANTASPANSSAADLYIRNRFEYYRKIGKISKKNWKT